MQDASLFAGRDGAEEEVRIGQLALRFLIDGPASGASVTIFEMNVPSGGKVPIAHSHDAFDETIYGLEGVLTMTLNGQSIEVGPGEALLIPRGAVHRYVASQERKESEHEYRKSFKVATRTNASGVVRIR